MSAEANDGLKVFKEDSDDFSYQLDVDSSMSCSEHGPLCSMGLELGRLAVTGDESTEDVVSRAFDKPGGRELVGKILELPPLPDDINSKQRRRILARRRTKIRLQATRVLRGFIQGGHIKQASRQDHARRRQRNASGRFTGAVGSIGFDAQPLLDEIQLSDAAPQYNSEAISRMDTVRASMHIMQRMLLEQQAVLSRLETER